ncbi:hypothetical protein [Paenibacillus sedimenti]|uniref:Uncharacterized protein n=1 Tax=Paenibacillus sedimenti TaxID=2770274 RepID=A0A926KQC1_9BACL|nr:hypothetical protein [Paenibacillus sedimenti]MBD0382112.1 hypothetical protein [Paenibacillus sedimenti]
MNEEQAQNRSKFVALMWSIVQPGLGHLYLGNKILGVIFMTISLITLIRTKLNVTIFCIFTGNFKKANLIFADNPTLFLPSVYSFAMWHAFNYDVIARKGNPREYKLTGFFFGFAIGGIPGTGQKFLGTHIITGLVIGVATGIMFHLIEKLILLMLNRVRP